MQKYSVSDFERVKRLASASELTHLMTFVLLTMILRIACT